MSTVTNPSTTTPAFVPGWYVCGIRSAMHRGSKVDPPWGHYTFGAINFSLYCYDENPTVKNDSVQYNQRRIGQRQFLTERQWERICASMGRMCVVGSGSVSRVVPIHDTEVVMDPDAAIPVEAFLYIEPSEAPTASHDGEAENEAPPSLEQTAPRAARTTTRLPAALPGAEAAATPLRGTSGHSAAPRRG